MRINSSLFVLAALGALSVPAQAVDTSQWKCESCPFEKTASGSVEAGAGVTTEKSAKYGDYTGLDRKGGFAILAGDARLRNADGAWADVAAADLGLDSRSVAAQGGVEGQFKAQFGVSEIPHRISDTGQTPFQGVGGGRLTLPFAAAPTTGDMPLAGTLQPVDIGFKRTRIDAGASWLGGGDFDVRVSVRQDKRDGTQRLGASFFSTSSQLVAPIDQVTDQLDVSVAYATRTLHASAGYQISLFRNNESSLTWDNPFTPVVAGATTGQLALAPNNDFHQVYASAGWEITPEIHASGDVAAGRMTQDAAYVAPTLNTDLAAGLAALPVQSLGGRADTFNGNLRVTATPMAGLRINATVARDVRDNRTPSNAYPALSTDMFVGATDRVNPAYDFKQNRYKINADWRGPSQLLLSGGLDRDDRERSYQEVVQTHETTVWGRGSAPVSEDLTLALKLSKAERRHSTYGVIVGVNPPENPLLRKYYLADRSRDAVNLRADLKAAESVSVSLNADYAYDDYRESAVGLTDGRTMDFGADVAIAVSDDIQLRLFTQVERIRSRQAGSQAFAQPDWRATSKDAAEVFGIGGRQVLLKGKLELDGDLVFSRSRSRTAVDTGATAPPFPTASTARDSLRLQATYKLQENLSLLGSWWYENYVARDWHQDDVGPATVANLLSLGEQAPRYHQHVLRAAVRYRF